MSKDAPKAGSQRREFERAALPHTPELRRVAQRLTRNERDAEDLVQDALLRAYANFHRFQAGTNCRAWLVRILTNTFINGYRRRVKEREILDRCEKGGCPERFFSKESQARFSQPERRIRQGRLGHDVREALAALPEDFRTVVVLADLQDFSYREIADEMGTPIGTVMSRLFRARRRLRRLLGAYAVEQGILPAMPEEALTA